MKTKGLIYILAVLFIFSWSACEDDNPMPKFEGDSASFMESSYNLNILSDFTYLEIPIYHKNPDKKGSKVNIEIITDVPSTVFSLDQNTANFDDADTVILKLTIDYNQLTDCEAYSIKLKFADDKNSLKVSYDGVDSLVVDFVKFKPLIKSDFVGTWSISEQSAFEEEPYADYLVEITDGTGNTMIIDNLWDSGIPVTVVLDDSDPNSFVFRIPDQNYFVHGTYGQVKIVDLGPGTINVCDYVISTSYKIYVPIGEFDILESSVWTKVIE